MVKTPKFRSPTIFAKKTGHPCLKSLRYVFKTESFTYRTTIFSKVRLRREIRLLQKIFNVQLPPSPIQAQKMTRKSLKILELMFKLKIKNRFSRKKTEKLKKKSIKETKRMLSGISAKPFSSILRKKLKNLAAFLSNH
jgi:hypothetical protein